MVIKTINMMSKDLVYPLSESEYPFGYGKPLILLQKFCCCNFIKTIGQCMCMVHAVLANNSRSQELIIVIKHLKCTPSSMHDRKTQFYEYTLVTSKNKSKRCAL